MSNSLVVYNKMLFVARHTTLTTYTTIPTQAFYTSMLNATSAHHVSRAIDAVLDASCALPPAEYDERVLSTTKLIADVHALQAITDQDDTKVHTEKREFIFHSKSYII